MTAPDNPAPPQLTLLCPVDELAEGSSRGFNDQRVFAVRQGGKIYVYHNSCPHLGIPLEWEENRFLDNTGSLIQCANHGALFVIKSGQCVAGPCTGQRLRGIAHRIIDHCIWIEV